MSSFNFGTPSSSSAPSNNNTTSAPTPGGLFGASTGTPSFSFGTLGNSSGANNNTTPADNAGSLFGQQNSGGAAKPAGGLFGGSSAAPGLSGTPTSSGPSLFGGNTSTTPATGAVFGGGGASTTPATTSAPASGGMFGSATNSTAPASGGMFGNAGNTSSKPAANAFGGGASTTPNASALFGGQNKANQAQGASATSTAPAAGLFASTGNSLFGSQPGQGTTTSMAGAATPAKPMFSLASTTPAGAPPADSSKAAPSALFQNNMAQPGTAGTASNLFSGGAKPAATQPGTSAPATSGLFGGAQATPAPAGGLFGAKSATTTAPPAGGLFGGANTTTATTQATSSTQAATTSTVGSMFGAKPAAATTSAPSSAPAAGLFGGAATTSASSGSTTTTAPAGGLFGAKPAATTAAATPAATTTAGGLFGGTPKPTTESKPVGALFGSPATTQAQTTTAPATTSAPATASLFGAKATTDTSKDTAKPATQNGTTSALGASTTGPTSQMARLKNKTMEDIVTRWASDLSKYQKEFKEQATTVSTWDRNLVENGEKIQKLYLDTFEAERASHEIERQLAAVEGQQDELEAWLDRYESEVQDMFAKQLGPGEQLAGPDQERERTYKLAEKLTQQLDEKSRDLSKMVKEINDISGTLSKGAKPEDPLSQIVRVLNGHLTQLQWIDANASALQGKVAAAQKSTSNLGNHYAGSDNDAAESFYRSYMGRR